MGVATKNIIRVLAAVYLLRILMANMGVTYFDAHNPVGRLMNILTNATHTDRMYKFFVQRTDYNCVLTFDVITGNDTIRRISTANKNFAPFINCSLNNTRFSALKYRFEGDTIARKLIATSMASKVLFQTPNAAVTTITAYKYHYPTMSEYAMGNTISYQKLYSTQTTL